MDSSLFSGVAALRAQERRLEAIAHNLANANTPAFKKSASITEGFQVERQGVTDEQPRTWHQTDWSQGDIKRTEVPTHLALMGEGFFTLEGDQGELYTRNGAFRLDDRGVLQTAEGYPLAWDGPRGLIDPVGTPVTIEPTGAVTQGGTRVGQLKLTNFVDADRLIIEETGFFRAPLGLQEVPTDAVVHQGALESANTSPVDELIAMIRVQRTFESVARMLTQIDESYDRLVNQNR